MAKRIKLSEFEKGEITALQRIGKSQREILKALRRSKTVIRNYLKSSKNMRQENQLAGQKNYHHNSREELFAK